VSPGKQNGYIGLLHPCRWYFCFTQSSKQMGQTFSTHTISKHPFPSNPQIFL